MTDFIVVVILAVVIGSAVRYLIKAKKSGAKCIGCPVGNGGCCCSHGQTESSSCSCDHEASSCFYHADAK